ncbi:MAG TPA: class I SAM-dependent RNA methyltransferase [Pyrinomonadaceae bacterium]|nr:class I SAM-dependent RNA methyltransferase [Pyrinomonadaceae bacterium]
MSKQYSVGDVLDVHVEKIVPRGFGLAFAEKLTVLIPLAAPGDELRVVIREIKKRLAFAEIVEVLSPGKDRVAPPCQYFGTCGGCDFQQLAYQAQLDAKVAIIRDSLARIGKIEFANDIPIISSSPLAYRSRVRWQVDRETRNFGYFKRNSHEVVNVEACPKLTPELNAVLASLRNTIDLATVWSDRLEIQAVSGGTGDVSIRSSEGNEPAAEVSWSSGGETYAFTAETFFQANKLLVPQLIDAAIGGAKGGTAFDLYSGVGLFTLPLARAFERVIGVEEHAAAAAFAKQNLENAGLTNAKAVTRSVQSFLADNRTTNVDLVLLDPPRAGTEKGVIAAIAKLKPKAISYVSCDPSILARDLRELLDSGYKIENLTALDLFPQTHHVETVARLTTK